MNSTETSSLAAHNTAHAHKWQQIGASPTLIRMIKYEVLLSWTGQPRHGIRREYPLLPEDCNFAFNEMDRWIAERFAEEISEAEARKVVLFFSVFVVHGSKPRVVIDYITQNEVLGFRKFWMYTLADLAPQLKPEYVLLKADVQDAYYHLRLRRCDREKLLFRIAGRFFRPLALNCGLSAAPWLCTKFLRPVVQELRRQGHRLISYLDDLSGAPRTDCPDTPSTPADAEKLGGKFDAFSPSWDCHFTPPRRISQGNKPCNCSELSSIPAANFTFFRQNNYAKFSPPPDCSDNPIFDANEDVPSATCNGSTDWPISRSPTPAFTAGSFQLFKRSHVKPPSNTVPPKLARFDLVVQPVYKHSRRTRNMGSHSICDPCHRRINGRLRCSHALSWKTRSLPTADPNRHNKHQSTSECWQISSRARSFYSHGCRTRFNQPARTSRRYSRSKHLSPSVLPPGPI
jgi:hypothetical protein